MRSLKFLIREESGAALILAAITIVVLLGFAGLAFDLTLGSASYNQATNNSKLAALAALEAYSADSGDISSKWSAALSAANEVAGWNNAIRTDVSGAQSMADGNDGVSAPKLIAGRYFPALEPDGSNPCTGTDTPPCFSEVSGSEVANAFQVKGPLFGKYKTAFMNVLGHDTVGSAEISATASVVPRLGCFVVDLSNSMTFETHKGQEFGRISLYSYKSPEYDAFFNTVPPTRDPLAPVVPTEHYRDDYELFQTADRLTDSDYGPAYSQYHPDPVNAVYSATGLEGDYHIDTFRSPDYQGPEPLMSVFNGINQAIRLFEEKSVFGDRACLIFHDDTLAWPRVVMLTEDLDYLKKLTDTTKYTVGDVPGGPLDMTRGLGLMIRHGFFPVIGSGTDLTSSIGEAMEQFRTFSNTNPGYPTSNFIVMFGDGLSNCQSCNFSTADLERMDVDNSGGDPRWRDQVIVEQCLENPNSAPWGNNCADLDLDANGDGFVNRGDFERIVDYRSRCGVGGCSNTWSFHDDSWKFFQRYVEYSVVPSRTPIHVIPVGSHIEPNTRVVANPEDGGCYTDAEMRSLEITGVSQRNSQRRTGNTHRSTYFSSMSSDNPYTILNGGYSSDYWGLWHVARDTGGVWGPLRPQRADCVPNLCHVDVNDSGRLRQTTDPLCRDNGQQIDDYMEKIMGISPYVIVKVE